jgi:hypothetical protein
VSFCFCSVGILFQTESHKFVDCYGLRVVTSFEDAFSCQSSRVSFIRVRFDSTFRLDMERTEGGRCVLSASRDFFCVTVFTFRWGRLYSLSPLRLELCISFITWALTAGRSFPSWVFISLMTCCVCHPFFLTECVIPQSLVCV